MVCLFIRELQHHQPMNWQAFVRLQLVIIDMVPVFHYAALSSYKRKYLVICCQCRLYNKLDVNVWVCVYLCLHIQRVKCVQILSLYYHIFYHYIIIVFRIVTFLFQINIFQNIYIYIFFLSQHSGAGSVRSSSYTRFLRETFFFFQPIQ